MQLPEQGTCRGTACCEQHGLHGKGFSCNHSARARCCLTYAHAGQLDCSTPNSDMNSAVTQGALDVRRHGGSVVQHSVRLQCERASASTELCSHEANVVDDGERFARKCCSNHLACVHRNTIRCRRRVRPRGRGGGGRSLATTDSPRFSAA